MEKKTVSSIMQELKEALYRSTTTNQLLFISIEYINIETTRNIIIYYLYYCNNMLVYYYIIQIKVNQITNS